MGDEERDMSSSHNGPPVQSVILNLTANKCICALGAECKYVSLLSRIMFSIFPPSAYGYCAGLKMVCRNVNPFFQT